MDQCEQLNDVVDDKESDQLIESDSRLIAGCWSSSSKMKVESVAEKVAWSSSVALVRGDSNCEGDGDGDGVNCGNLISTEGSASSIIKATSSKWAANEQITESHVDDLVDDEGGSLIVVHNRSARRMETLTESIVTRKVRRQVIEMDEDDNEGEPLIEEQLISALSSSSIDDHNYMGGDSSPDTMNSPFDCEKSESLGQQQVPISTVIKSRESESTAILSSTKSCWSSSTTTTTENIESIDEIYMGQTADSLNETTIERASEHFGNSDGGGGDEDVVGGDDDDDDDNDDKSNKLDQKVWSRIEKIRDEYEKTSSLSLQLSSPQSHAHQVWSESHSESIESTESTEFSSIISSTEMNGNRDSDYDQDDDEDDNDDDDNSNSNGKDISRFNFNVDHENDNDDDESFESDKEVAISLRRPSLSLVKAEAYVFRSRRSLEELETEIVIRKKSKPKINKEMAESATIFISNCDSPAIKETPTPPSLPLSPLSMRSIPENRRDNLIESLNNYGSLDTENDSNEDDEEEIIEESTDSPVNCLDGVDQLSQLADVRCNWNHNPLTTVFKSDREIADLF